MQRPVPRAVPATKKKPVEIAGARDTIAESAERSLLAAIVRKPDLVKHLVEVPPDDFAFPFPRTIRRALGGLADRGAPITLIDLYQELLNTGQLDAAGGLSYISALTDPTEPIIATDGYVVHRRNEIRKAARARRVQHKLEALRAQVALEGLSPEVRRQMLDIADAVSASEGVGAPWRSLFKSPSEMDAGPIRFGIQGFLPEGVNFIGGLSGHGKSWIGLSIAKALSTGEKFLGTFNVPSAVPVIYLIPEVGERAFSRRLSLMRISDSFLCRTMRDGILKLNDPRLLAAIAELQPWVILDTAIRFSEAESENSANENHKGLADGCFGLLRAGARGVVGLHHAGKNFMDSEPTLETTLRGTGDIGAMCDSVYAVRMFDKETVEIEITCVKPRDFEPPGAFRVRGRPFINERADLGMMAPKESPEHAQKRVRLDAIERSIPANQGSSQSRIIQKLDIKMRSEDAIALMKSPEGMKRWTCERHGNSFRYQTLDFWGQISVPEIGEENESRESIWSRRRRTMPELISCSEYAVQVEISPIDSQGLGTVISPSVPTPKGGTEGTDRTGNSKFRTSERGMK